MSGDALVGVVNAGSSSLKFALFEGERRVARGEFEGLNATPSVRAFDAAGEPIEPPGAHGPAPRTAAEAMHALVPWFGAHSGGRIHGAIGHRVVHGGTKYSSPQFVTPELLKELKALVPLAPLHEPHNLAPIEAVMEIAPDVPQVACFDTAFHRSNPPVQQAFALPYEYFERGVLRYGFHGLSYEYVATALPSIAPDIAGGRVVAAHLGSGASLCGMAAGRSVATTMGFTALDGVPMSTRSGALDPGVVLYCIEQLGMSSHDVTELLYKRSGMLGLSGVSADFRDLLASREPRAAFAVAVFVDRVAREIASLACAIGGIDAVVFTAGVGENAPAIRAAVGERCAWLGLRIDSARNQACGVAARISAGDSAVAAYVLPTDEEITIARHVRRVLGD